MLFRSASTTCGDRDEVETAGEGELEAGCRGGIGGRRRRTEDGGPARWREDPGRARTGGGGGEQRGPAGERKGAVEGDGAGRRERGRRGGAGEPASSGSREAMGGSGEERMSTGERECRHREEEEDKRGDGPGTYLRKKKDQKARWRDLKGKREKKKRAAAKRRGWERKTTRAGLGFWRLGGLLGRIGLLSRNFSKYFFIFFSKIIWQLIFKNGDDRLGKIFSDN